MTISHRLEAGMCKMESEKFSTFSKCREMCSTCANIPYLASIINRVATYGAFIYQHFSGCDEWLPDPTYCSMSALCSWQHIWVQMQWEAGSFIKLTCVMKAETLSNTQTLFSSDWSHYCTVNFKFNNLHSQFMR